MSHFADITTIQPVCVVTTGDMDNLKRLRVPVDGTTKDGVSVLLERSDNGVRIYLTADNTPVSWVRLTFPAEFPAGTLFLGDEWERGYGTLGWRGMVAERHMPWYFAAYHRESRTFGGYGVRVRPGAMCVWGTDAGNISLYLDVRSRGRGVVLSGRRLMAAEIVFTQTNDTDAYDGLRSFCRLMCGDPRLPEKPVYGFNNWYYAYGRSSREDILADADLLSDVTKGLANRPFMTIDAGWEIIKPGQAMWSRGRDGYGDMARLASDISSRGVIPGIWTRPLKENAGAVPDEWRLPANSGGESFLDPTVPEALDYVKEQISRIVGWGYRLIKHDFTTYDMFGLWGKDMGFSVTNSASSFSDRGITSAEVVGNLYGAIREAAGDAVIIGCNTIPHLSAGIFELSRIGDDTSGLYWDRTRRMGVNALAFRLAHNGVFYMDDADCVGIIDKHRVPFELNRRWMDLVARSGSPLFISCDPKAADDEVREAVREAFRSNSEQRDDMRPLDWLDNNCPREWLINGRRETFVWHDKYGYDAVADPRT